MILSVEVQALVLTLLSTLTLAVAVASIVWTLSMEVRRRHERPDDEKRHTSNYQHDVGADYDAIEVSALLEKFQYHKARCEGNNTKYWEDYVANQPGDLKDARRKLKKFWERTVDAFNAGSLPDNFFSRGSFWLQSGHDYRMVVEPIDIANYYYLGLWKESKHYLEDNNRPHAYKFLQEKWEEVNYPVDSTELAKDWQLRVDNTGKDSK